MPAKKRKIEQKKKNISISYLIIICLTVLISSKLTDYLLRRLLFSPKNKTYSSEQIRLQQWPQIQIPISSMPGNFFDKYHNDATRNLPSVPVFPKISVYSESDFKTKKVDRQLRKITYEIIKATPIPLVNDFLLKKVLANKVFFSFFHIDKHIPGFFYIYESLPCFNFDPYVLINLDDEEAVYNFMLIVFHETVHYLRWYNKEGYFNLNSEDKTLKCAAHFNEEVTAYWHSCSFQNQWGLIDSTELCDATAFLPAFYQRLFFLLSLHDSKRDQCVSIWAQMVGHPHPEAF